jgi:hypothetical protein
MNKKQLNQKEQYKGYVLKITENTKETGENRFVGKAYKENDPKATTEATGKNRDDVLKQVKENLDDLEERFATPSIAENAESEKSTSEPAKNETIENPTIQNAGDEKNENSNAISEKLKNTPKNQPNNSDSSLAALEKFLEKHFSSITKKIETIEERLEKLESNREQNDLIRKVEGLTQITRDSKTNVEDFRKEFAEKSQSQANQFSDILNKLDVLVEIELFNERLVKLQSQSEKLHERLDKLHERLDKKIDLQDAEHLFDLRNEIEKDIESDLIQTISKKIMPVLDNLKDKIKNDPEKISDAMQDLESRCISAGLKRLRGI